MQLNKQYAVITGTSSGLGKCYALELARRGINTVLISLADGRLEGVAQEVRTYGTDCVTYETNISDKENLLKMCHQINENHEVFMLINNAGTGGTKSFTDCSVEYVNNIIQLNIMATTLLTHQLLPNMMKRPKAYVLNVSSMAAFSPIGYKTVYPASKRFIHHFTRGLYQELKHTSVFVSVVNPGPMKTNEDIIQRIELQGKFGQMGLLSPERVAQQSIAQLFKRDTMILLGWSNKINWLLMNIVPIWIRLPLMSKVVSREIQVKAI